MTRRKRLTDTDVVGLPVKADRYTLPDPELRGHYIRVSTGGGSHFGQQLVTRTAVSIGGG